MTFMIARPRRLTRTRRRVLAAERSAGTRLIIASSISVALYLSLTAISVFKPWARTARGRRYGVRSTTPARSAAVVEEVSA